MIKIADAERRLVAIFAADIEGYSRLMQNDKVGTLRDLTERRRILDGLIASRRITAGLPIPLATACWPNSAAAIT